MASVSSAPSTKRRHVSHDGTIREYDFQSHTWTIIDSSSNNAQQEQKKQCKTPLAIEGRAFDLQYLFPHWYDKTLMNLEVLKTFNGKFTIHGCPLYIGNQVNNELITRKASNQQHGDTGNNVWDCSISICKCLEHNTFAAPHHPALNMSGKTVLELGAGTGLVGLSAAHCGAKYVYLTDLAYCIENMRVNVQKNKFLYDHHKRKNKESTQSDQEAKKSSDDQEEESNPFDTRVDVFELDWLNYQQSLGKYNKLQANSVDVIIGSDIVWVKDLVPSLVSTLDYLYDSVLDKQHGIILIGEQVRSKHVSQLFWSMLENKGFRRTPVEHKFLDAEFMSDKVQLHIVSKRNDWNK